MRKHSLWAAIIMAAATTTVSAQPNSMVCKQLVATMNGPVCLTWAKAANAPPPPPFLAQPAQAGKALGVKKPHAKKIKKHRRRS